MPSKIFTDTIRRRCGAGNRLVSGSKSRPEVRPGRNQCRYRPVFRSMTSSVWLSKAVADGWPFIDARASPYVLRRFVRPRMGAFEVKAAPRLLGCSHNPRDSHKPEKRHPEKQHKDAFPHLELLRCECCSSVIRRPQSLGLHRINPDLCTRAAAGRDGQIKTVEAFSLPLCQSDLHRSPTENSWNLGELLGSGRGHSAEEDVDEILRHRVCRCACARRRCSRDLRPSPERWAGKRPSGNLCSCQRPRALAGSREATKSR